MKSINIKLTGNEKINDKNIAELLNNLNYKKIANNILKLAKIFNIQTTTTSEEIINAIIKCITNNQQMKKDFKDFYNRLVETQKGFTLFKNINCPQFTTDVFEYSAQMMSFLNNMQNKKSLFKSSSYDKMVNEINNILKKYNNNKIEGAFLSDKSLELTIINVIKKYLANNKNSGKRSIMLNQLIVELKKLNDYRANMVLSDKTFTTDNEGKMHDSRNYQNAKNLVYFTLPKNITVVPQNFFKGSGIKKLTIDHVVNNIKLGAFENCKQLRKIVGKGEIKKIENDAFKNCLALETISVKGFYDEKGTLKFPDAFKGCIKLPQQK